MSKTLRFSWSLFAVLLAVSILPNSRAHAETAPNPLLANFDTAIQLADAITYADARDDAYIAIAKALLKIDPERSLAIASKISNDAWRNGGLQSAVQELVKRDPDRAVTAAAQLTTEPKSSSFLIKTLAEEIAKRYSGPRALALFDRLFEMAKGIGPASGSQHTLSELAVSMADIDPSRAAAAAEQYISDTTRDRTLARITVKAASDLPTALEISKRISDPVEKGHASAMIIPAVVASDRPFAIRFAKGITDPGSRFHALLGIVFSIGRDSRRTAIELLTEAADAAGQVSEQALQDPLLRQVSFATSQFDVELGIQFARRISDLSTRAEALERIAVSTHGLDPLKQRDILATALDYAKQAKDPGLIAKITADLLNPPAPASAVKPVTFW